MMKLSRAFGSAQFLLQICILGTFQSSSSFYPVNIFHKELLDHKVENCLQCVNKYFLSSLLCLLVELQTDFQINYGGFLSISRTLQITKRSPGKMSSIFLTEDIYKSLGTFSTSELIEYNEILVELHQSPHLLSAYENVSILLMITHVRLMILERQSAGRWILGKLMLSGTKLFLLYFVCVCKSAFSF